MKKERITPVRRLGERGEEKGYRLEDRWRQIIVFGKVLFVR